MAPFGANEQKDEGVGESVADIWQLVQAYAKQETIDPLKAIGRFLGYGLAGAFLLAVGVFLVTLAIIRGLQTETGEHLTGSWNWVPYAVGLVFTVIVAGLAARSITKRSRSSRDRA